MSAMIPAGLGDRCLVIAEIGLTHDGSLGLAHAFIDAVAKTGADAVKFQTHIAAAESTPAEPFRVAFTYQDANRYDYWKRMEFSEAQWRGLADHAAQKNLLFLSSPFSVEAVELLIRVGVSMWKIGSGEVGDVPLIDRVGQTGQPVLLSSGMSSVRELDSIVNRLEARHVPLALLQCTSAYPCPPEKIGLNMLEVFRQRYSCLVGLSDHSGTIYPALAAATLGADVIETHVTLSREMFGPDVVASVTTSELTDMVRGVRFIERIRTHPVDKDVTAEEMDPLRRIFTKSVVARVTLEPGTSLTTENVSLRKPGTGIPASRLPQLLGRRVRRRIAEDTLLTEDDIDTDGAEST